MARRYTRSGGDSQVVPDTTLARRFELPYSWDVQVSQAPETFPLVGRRDAPSIFDQVHLDLRLAAKDPKLGGPVIWYGGHRLYTVNKEGGDTPKKAGSGSQATALWTVTSKMTCPSFSLPAGPTVSGGSCAIANTGRSGGKRTPGKTYICDGCYSLEGQYVYPVVTTAQAARQAWVLQELAADDSGITLGHKLAAAIEDQARYGTLRNPGERLTQELGVWHGGQIVVPLWVPALERLAYRPAFSTPLPAAIGVPDTRAWFEARGVQEDEVVGFFRIHDSGDFTAGPHAALWPAYLDAWVEVARIFPNVIFWAPTRLWALPSVNRQLRTVLASVPNLVVRPSALNVMDPAPTIDGLANGTTVGWVHGKKGAKTFDQTMDQAGNPTYNCPVYLLEQGKSCMAAGCRACWLAPRTAVSYGYH